MSKKAYFYIDDVIWTLRDITRQRPKSIFDNEFMKMLKTAHDSYGMKVQLNLFARTDFAYGNDEFTLADVTEDYKSEFEAASDWLKFGFHSKQEFPDYPYINATYEDVDANFKYIQNEVFRFAGKNSFAYGVCTHWLPMSKAGVKAFVDNGVKILNVSRGDRKEFDEEKYPLPFGHGFRVTQGKTPEAGVYTNIVNGVETPATPCGYNHITMEEAMAIFNTCEYVVDKETGMAYKPFCTGICFNSIPIEEIEKRLTPQLDKEFVGYAVHEQYFYKDYGWYQPDYADKLFYIAKTVHENGFEHIFIEDIAE